MNAIWIEEDSKVRTVSLPLNETTPLGFVSTNRLIFIGAIPTRRIDFAVSEIELGEKPAVCKNWHITLPITSEVEMVELSPRGSKILWKLRRPRPVPKLIETDRFPFVRAEPAWEGSIWISDIAGNNFVTLGTLPAGESFGSTFAWSPEEKHISTLIRGKLHIFDVPEPRR